MVETSKLRFRAKGYLCMFCLIPFDYILIVNTTPIVKNEIQTQTMTARTPEGTTVDAIIYNAPCVVKVVPYDVGMPFHDLQTHSA